MAESSDTDRRQFPSIARWRTLLAAAILAIAVGTAYFPVFTAGFVWDDYPALHYNAFLPRADGLVGIWTTHGRIPNESHYWPMVYTMYWFEYRRWGLNAPGYHTVNVVIHALNCLLLWALLRRIGATGGWLAALLFAVHPAHVESVAWVHERKDVLSMLWYLAAFRFFVPFEEARHGDPPSGRARWGLYAAALACFVGGMLTKSVVVTLPVGLGVYVWWRRGRLTRRDAAVLAPFLAIGAAFTLTDMAMMRDVDAWDSGLSPAGRLVLAGQTFWFYARTLALPFGLTTIYPRWQVDAASPIQWLWPLATGVLPVALILARHRIGRAPAAAVLFFGATLAPMLGLVDFAFLRISWVADRFQYLAGAAPLALAGAGLARLIAIRRIDRRRIAIASVAVLMALLGVLTNRYAARYRDALTLFRSAAEHNPDSPFVRANLGAALGMQGQYAEAEAELHRALRDAPGDLKALSNLGVVLAHTGRTAGAVAVYRRALAAGARSYRVINDLAWFLATSPDASIRDGDEAVRLAQAASRMTGDADPSILDTLAAAYAEAGRYGDARTTARRALDLARRDGKPPLAQAIARRLRTFEQNQPWREPR